MDFYTFWQALSAEEKRAFAEAVETSVGYLHLIAGGHRQPGPDMAKRMVAADSRLSKAMLRPDLWSDTAA